MLLEHCWTLTELTQLRHNDSLLSKPKIIITGFDYITLKNFHVILTKPKFTFYITKALLIVFPIQEKVLRTILSLLYDSPAMVVVEVTPDVEWNLILNMKLVDSWFPKAILIVFLAV